MLNTVIAQLIHLFALQIRALLSDLLQEQALVEALRTTHEYYRVLVLLCCPLNFLLEFFLLILSDQIDLVPHLDIFLSEHLIR